MATMDLSGSPVLQKLVDGLHTAMGDDLVSVVLYGSAARGDYDAAASDLNVLIVVRELAPEALEHLSGPIRRWDRSGQPMPRLLSPTIIQESADVFPIEFLDIRASHRVLHGTDPFTAMGVHLDHLRAQCERELREKMMRLREAYLQAHDAPSVLTRLLAISENYPQLRSNENFIRLQDELAGSENRIAVERRRYNETVRTYNTQVQVFPTNMVAGLFSFSDREYFEADEAAAQVPQVEFQ